MRKTWASNGCKEINLFLLFKPDEARFNLEDAMKCDLCDREFLPKDVDDTICPSCRAAEIEWVHEGDR